MTSARGKLKVKRARSKPRRRPKPVTEQESQQLLANITRMINAWQKHAPHTKFAGMSLDEFRKAVQPSFDTHAVVSRLEWEMEQLKKLIDEEEAEAPKRH